MLPSEGEPGPINGPGAGPMYGPGGWGAPSTRPLSADASVVVPVQATEADGAARHARVYCPSSKLPTVYFTGQVSMPDQNSVAECVAVST